MYWRYDLNINLSQLLKDQTVTSGQEAIIINLLELCGMVLTAFVTQVILQDRPETKGDPVLLRGENVTVVSWVNRCGGSCDKRASLAMRLLSRLEITSGWSHAPKHIPGVKNVIADGISTWPKNEIASNLRSLVTEEWKEQDIGDSGRVFFIQCHNPYFSMSTLMARYGTQCPEMRKHGYVPTNR